MSLSFLHERQWGFACILENPSGNGETGELDFGLQRSFETPCNTRCDTALDILHCMPHELVPALGNPKSVGVAPSEFDTGSSIKFPILSDSSDAPDLGVNSNGFTKLSESSGTSGLFRVVLSHSTGIQGG